MTLPIQIPARSYIYFQLTRSTVFACQTPISIGFISHTKCLTDYAFHQLISHSLPIHIARQASNRLPSRNHSSHAVDVDGKNQERDTTSCVHKHQSNVTTSEILSPDALTHIFKFTPPFISTSQPSLYMSVQISARSCIYKCQLLQLHHEHGSESDLLILSHLLTFATLSSSIISTRHTDLLFHNEESFKSLLAFIDGNRALQFRKFHIHYTQRNFPYPLQVLPTSQKLDSTNRSHV